MRRLRAAVGVLLAVASASLLAPAPAHAAGPALERVSVCGTSLCVGTTPWAMKAVSIYGAMFDPGPAIAMAQEAGANTIRLTDFLQYGTPAQEAVASEEAWARVDAVIATSAAAGLRVLLDLSPYRNLLTDDGLNPYVVDWTAYLTTAAARVNTITGVAYRDDPTIALVSIAGEPLPPHGDPGPTVPTSRQLTDFFTRTLAQWHALAPSTLVNVGGFLHLDWESGIEWERIMALPGNDVCAIHIYGHRSLRKGLPALADYCTELGKPWLMEETGVPQRIGDPARARWLSRVIAASWDLGAAGVGVWNIGGETTDLVAGTYDVNPLTPRAWYAVQHGFARGPRRA